MGLIDESNLPESCPICKGNDLFPESQGNPSVKIALSGPYTRYQQRDDELFFDLKEKYLKCPNCGNEITVIDFQVMVDRISATLPPEEARAFSMKMMSLYRNSRDHAIEVLSILTGDFSDEPGLGDDFLNELDELIRAPRHQTK
jgi:hypothetical protein